MVTLEVLYGNSYCRNQISWIFTHVKFLTCSYSNNVVTLYFLISGLALTPPLWNCCFIWHRSESTHFSRQSCQSYHCRDMHCNRVHDQRRGENKEKRSMSRKSRSRSQSRSWVHNMKGKRCDRYIAIFNVKYLCLFDIKMVNSVWPLTIHMYGKICNFKIS